MGRLFKTIEDLGLYEETAVLLLSDHVYSIGDHDRVGKSGRGTDGSWPFAKKSTTL